VPGFDIANSIKILRIYSVSYFNLSGLGALFGGGQDNWWRDCFLH